MEEKMNEPKSPAMEAAFSYLQKKLAGEAVDPPPVIEEDGPPKIELKPTPKQPDAINLSLPANKDHTLTALPLVRNWLFAPDRTTHRYRHFEVETSHKGRTVTQSISIGDRFAAEGKGYGVLTTRHQRVIFALQCLWQKQGGRLVTEGGQRLGTVCCSSWQLEAMFNGVDKASEHGGWQRRRLRQAIHELVAIPIKIENYLGPDGRFGTVEMNGLISGYLFSESRKVDPRQMGFPWVEITLSHVITASFERSEVKPINLKVLNSLQTEIAQLLYPKFDYLLSSNPITELRLDGLVEKLGLRAKQLSQLGHRRRLFEPALRELNGQPLSLVGDYIIKAELVPTADEQDVKIIVERKRQI